MSLKDRAVGAADTEADAKRNAAREGLRERIAATTDIVTRKFGGDQPVVFVDHVDVDRPHMVHGGDRFLARSSVSHEAVRVFRFRVDDVLIGAVYESSRGDREKTPTLYVESTCRECGQRTWLAPGPRTDQSGTTPWGYASSSEPYGWDKEEGGTADHFRSSSLPEHIRKIGQALNAKPLCAGCLLNIPEECPSCNRRLRY